MTRSLMTATAVGLILAGPAVADNHMATNYIETLAEGELQASNLLGMRIYATESEIGEDATVAEGGEQEWDDIGEINDIVLDRDGAVRAVVLGVGGFLGLGEKDVAVDMESLRFVAYQDDPDDFFLVVNSSKQMLEDAPAFQSREMREQAEAMEEQEEEMQEQREEMAAATESSDQQAEGAPAAELPESRRPMLTAPDVEREGYQEVAVQDLTAEMLQGITVYGPEDENVGEIGELILNDGGQITEAVIDVGGFLGIGERNVAVMFEELRILRGESGADFRVYIDSSEEQLEQLPEYEG